MFEEILKRLDSIDKRCGRWEKTAADIESERKEQGDAMDCRVANLEEKVPAQEKTSAAQICELEELGAAVGDRTGTLEQFYGAQTHDAIVIDNWGHEIKQRIEEVENHVGDLELIHLRELHGENDDRLATLEVAVAVIEEWWPHFEGTLNDVQLEVKRLKRGWDRTPLEPAPAQLGEEICPAHDFGKQDWDRTPLEHAPAQPGAEFSQPMDPVIGSSSAAGVPHDWPDGRRFAHDARERGYGSVMTLVQSCRI